MNNKYVQDGYVEQGYVGENESSAPATSPITTINYIVDKRVFEKDYGECDYAVGYVGTTCEISAGFMKMYMSDGTGKNIDDVVAKARANANGDKFMVFAPEFGALIVGDDNFTTQFVSFENFTDAVKEQAITAVQNFARMYVAQFVKRQMSNIQFTAEFVLDGNVLLETSFTPMDNGVRLKVPDEIKCADYEVRIKPL